MLGRGWRVVIIGGLSLQLHNCINVLDDLIDNQLVERVADCMVEFINFCQVLLLDIGDLKWFKIGIVAIARINTFVFGALLANHRARVSGARIAHILLIFISILKYK